MKPAILVLLAATALAAQPADPGWPRSFTDGTSEVVVYQPQIDRWTDFKNIAGRSAFALRPARNQEPVYGTFRFEAETLTDPDRRVVLMRSVRVFDMRFPSAPGGASAQWAAIARRVLPSSALVVSLDRILAFMKASEVPQQDVRILTEPPPILVSTNPAALVILDGEPVMMTVENTALRKVVNTNWELLHDSRSNLYYLRHEAAWLAAPSLEGPYARAADLPAGLERAPLDANSAETPRVIVVKRPAELIVLRGAPELAPIAGTRLSLVKNTDSDVFFHAGERSYYFLTSGRWFQSASLDGPWMYASLSLPPDFRNFPTNHPKAHVLASVPGTREAEDAVLLASIPRTAEINRREAKAEVQYVGAPEFVPITGTSMSYAKNTPSDVLRVGGLYYLCFQGVWFVSTKATGPWQAAEKVPQEIYTIPESSPKYNVTYVRIYQSTPTTIVVGYTPGYYGAYVSGGVVVWGTGYYYPPYVAVGVAAVPVYWAAPCYTYGASAWYNPATGTYARGGAVYGPNGGYAAGAAYNPRTGTYAQGAAGYNRVTGNYAAGYNATNPYGSWGQGVVGNGSGDWARGGYQSTSRGTVAAGQTSQGGAGVAVQGANGNSGYLAKSGSGDIYAGANGNVYKRDDGQWYKNQDGSWNAMERSQVSAQQQQEAAARDRGTRNAQMSERARPAGGSGTRPQGVQQRPQFQGRRK